jgi:1-acyl-sn-glycerol-3-phosphate acyltransferase
MLWKHFTWQVSAFLTVEHIQTRPRLFFCLKIYMHIATTMSLYTSTQRFLRFGFRLFYNKVHIKHIGNFPTDGPVLLVSNHPNSFMDALVIGAYLPRPTHFLARGDAFKNPILAKVFKTYHMLPVYRISEGKENIEKNFETFDASYNAINKAEVVLIFGEGLCENNWALRSLKKGPARIANRAWNSNDVSKDMVILPVGLTYEHYDGAGKSLIINYGTPITKNDMKESLSSPTFVQQLNDKIATALQELAYINKDLKSDSPEHNQMMKVWQEAERKKEDVLTVLKQTKFSPGNKLKTKSEKRTLTKFHLSQIALPHYWLMDRIATILTRGSVFYDSILFGFTLFLLPLYLIVLGILVWWLV